MRCPICNINKFEAIVLEDDLRALNCTECGGHWINSFQYWLWQEKLPQKLEEKKEKSSLQAVDVKKMKKCPECNNILQRYAVGHGTDFEIDRCEKCRGIWFDKNELEILKDKNLHDEIHFIFSNHWQSEARKEKMSQNRETMLEKLVGEEGVTILKEFKNWYQKQNDKSTITAFLNN